MSNFRLVLLDYAKNQLHNPVVKKVLADLITVKQKNFERTDPNYIVLDKHDMIGTHILIYDTENLYEPNLVFALRLTYEDRANQYKIKTPIQDLMPVLNSEIQRHYTTFKENHPVLADCNSWFVDPQFSKKNSGLNLSDIGYTAVYLQVMRMGLDHILGCTNEKYKAHRWLENIGEFQKNLNFIHPTVTNEHMFIIIEKFKHLHLHQVYSEHKNLFDTMLEIVPEQSAYASIQQCVRHVFHGANNSASGAPTLTKSA